MRNITILGARGGGKTILRDYYLRMIEEGERIMGKETKWTLTMTDDGFEIGSTDGEKTFAFGKDYVKMSSKAFLDLQKELIRLKGENDYLNDEYDRLRDIDLEYDEQNKKLSELEKEKDYYKDLYKERLKLYNEVVEDYNKLRNKQLQEDYCRADVEMLAELYKTNANAKIAKLERKIELMNESIEVWRGNFESANAALLLSDDDRHVVYKALEIAVKHINAVNYSPFDTRPAITVNDYISKAKEEMEND